MSLVFTIEPRGGWKAGDRAYCVRGSRRTSPTLEAGKVYVVAEVLPLENMVGDGLVIEGVQLPDGHRGTYSSRFVRLPSDGTAGAAVERMVKRSWCEAYMINTGQADQLPA